MNKHLLDAPIEELEELDAARQQALEKVKIKATHRHNQSELTEACTEILSWLDLNRGTAGEEKFEQKLVELREMKGPSKLRDRLEQILNQQRRHARSTPRCCKNARGWRTG